MIEFPYCGSVLKRFVLMKTVTTLAASRKRLSLSATRLKSYGFAHRKPVPEYILKDTQYYGGIDRQYQYERGNEARAVAVGGGVLRRWDPAVRERFQKLFLALSKEFDGRVARMKQYFRPLRPGCYQGRAA